MHIVILSDIHQSVSTAKKILESCKNADLFLFLGDGVNEFVSLCEQMRLPHKEVYGNCDFFLLDKQTLSECVINVENLKIFFTHGHKYGVKYSDDKVIRRAKELGAHVVLYGHTHKGSIRYTELDGHEMTVINCASVHQNGAFATLDIRNSQILPNLASLAHK